MADRDPSDDDAPDQVEEALADSADSAVAEDDVAPSRGEHLLPVVGLGGSAGSIPALRTFFARTAPDSGLAYVVVLHLAPEQESILPALLQRHTAMPVGAARDGESFEPDRVYVIPPGKHLIAVDGHLRLTDLQREHGKRTAVDLFFRSLADTHGPHGTAVVLSGADGDGAIGIKRIKERGGLTIAQDPQEAEHSSMPSSAIATGMVDWVLPVADMPSRIVEYVARERRLRLPAEDGPTPVPRPEPAAADQPEALLRELLAFLHARTGRDFSYYKRATIVRRISRRMQVSGMLGLDGYLDHLRTHPGEAGALLQDLLISVTNFFRDSDAFAALEALVPELFRDKGPGHFVRVWCAACATGEEAYSMAMLLLEHARTLETPPTLQVFGCDLDEEAIQIARAGFYPDSIAADVSEERLRRFFTKEPGGWRVRRELREMVLFASHDLLKDAPFSRMDLVSCRNLLIYLNRDAQKRALDIFHFASRPGGLLFLGVSESVDETSPLYVTVDKKNRIYRQRPAQRIGVPMPTGAADGALQRVIHHQERLKASIGVLPDRSFLAAAGDPSLASWRARDEATQAADSLHFRLLGRFGPASAVIDAEHDVVHLSDNAGRYLQMPEGEPTRNLFRLVRPALRVELRAAVLRAEETGHPVDVLRRDVDVPGERVAVEVHVTPAGDLAPGSLLIVFDERVAEPGSAASAPVDDAGTLASAAVVQQLERELTRAQSGLRATIEQYEASTEELKASNEELQAMNEELRSAGEELETGREELQSVNEELTTVNAEFRNRVEELGRTNSDLRNLMTSTQIATVFLGRELEVMRYTPPAAPLFNLIPSDIGRPIGDLHRRLEYPELAADATQVLQTLVPVERELREDGHWYLARMLPYRTIDDHIDGVVLTFVDITERRHVEQALRESEASLAGQKEAFEAAVSGAPLAESLGLLVRSAVEHAGSEVRCAFYLADEAKAELHHVAGLPADYAEDVQGFRAGPDAPPAGSAVHADGPVITPDVTRDPRWTPWLWLAEKHGFRGRWSFPVVAEGGVVGTFAMIFREPREPSGRDLEFASLLTRAAAIIVSRGREIEERARAEAAIRESELRLRMAVEGGDLATWEWNLRSDDVYWNERHFTLLGIEPRPNPVPSDLFFRHLHADDKPRVVRELQAAIAEKKAFDSEFRAVLGDGAVRWMSGYGHIVAVDAAGRPTKMSGVMLDIDGRKTAERALRDSEARTRAIADHLPGGAVFVVDRALRYVLAGGQALAATGATPDTYVGRRVGEVPGPGLGDDAEAAFGRAFAGETFEGEHAYRGRRFVVRGGPLRDAAGEITAALAVSHEVTDGAAPA